MPDGALRARRRECGLTQSELASRAGVSRQLVAAVEAGQNSPSVDAALRLAQVLGTSVEALFADAPAGCVAALGGELRPDIGLRVGRVGDQLVAAELADRGVAGAVWSSPDGVIRDGSLHLFDRTPPAGLVLAGCDPALGVAEAMLRGFGVRSLMAISGPTGTALDALAGGRLHAAVVHGRPGTLPTPPLPVVRWHLARWQVGMGIAPELKRRSLEDLLEGDVPVVGRDPAAASQQAFDREVARLGGRWVPRAPRAGGHIEAARLAASLHGAGITTEPAARAFHLRFVPLEDHVVEIWLDRRWLHHPGVAALGEVLSAPAFTERVAQFGGYDLAGCGQLIDG